MRIIKREFENVTRPDTFHIIPIGDVHVGAAACDEEKLKRDVERIAKDPSAYWIGLGDYADFINMKDPRFNPGSLASWIGIGDLADLAAAQRDYFLDMVRPIARKCLALVEGNHEGAIAKHYERSIYWEIASGIKQAAGWPADYPLTTGIYGWLRLLFRRSTEHARFDVNLHHGYVGGKLAGGKALEMQRWLWTHDCDVAIFGHSHNTEVQVEEVEAVDQYGGLTRRKRYGCYAGSYLRTVNEDGPATYSEAKGYLPLPNVGVEIWLTPGVHDKDRAIRILTGC